MATIEVGLGDSPQRIAERITGNPHRYRELLAVNPHKSIVHVDGQPTFATLGVGEPIAVPDGWLGASYADDLAAAGLHPDNPDAMFAALQSFLSHPQAFKNADPHWRGTKDNLSWWEEPHGVARLIWPFHYGKWMSEGPKSEAQIRAAFKIPAGTGTKEGLSKLYGFPFRSDLSYSLPIDNYEGGGGFDLGSAVNSAVNAVKQGVGSVVDVANALRIPGINLTTAILTGKNPIDALKADISSFTDAAKLAQNVVSGNTGAIAADLTAQAAKLGISLPPAAVQAAVQAAQSGKSPQEVATTALGSNYTDAWSAATNGGKILSDLPVPPGLSYQVGATADASAHPLTVAAKKEPIHLSLQGKALTVPVDHAAVAQAVTASAGTAAAASPVTSPTPAPAAQAAPSAGAYGPYPKQ